MFSYVALNILVLVGLAVVIMLWPQKLAWKPLALILLVLLIMTAIFDSLIIANGVVAYQVNRLLGVYVLKAPVEDFAYTVAAVVLIPYLWKRYARKD